MHVLWATVLHLALPAQENPKMRSFNIPSLALVMLAAACSGNPSAPATSQAAGPTTTELVAKFDASAGELPEGLVFTREAAYVGFAPTSQVMRVDVGTGRATQYAQLPAPVAGKGFMTGLAESPTGDLYAGLASFVPEVQAGIYRVSKQSGEVSLFARDAALPFPNGLAFDASGALFATDSGSGSIFRFDAHGNAERWSSDQTLLGDAKACDGAGPGFAIGANGIVVEPDAVYVVNLDQATLLRFPRAEDGSAGSVTIVAGPDCETLGGADGLARAPDGSFVVAVNRQNKLVSVTLDGKVRTLAQGEPLDFPASIAYRGATLFATNFAFHNASAGLPAHPGLLRIAP
jgi:sugar lactone lactonase YvrE